MFLKLPLLLLAWATTLCRAADDLMVQAGPSSQQCQSVQNIIKVLEAGNGGRPWCRHILGLNVVKTITTTVTKTPTVFVGPTKSVTITAPTKTVTTTATSFLAPTGCTGNYRQGAPTKRADTAPVTPASDVAAIAGAPTMPSALSSYTSSRRVLACKCLKLPSVTSTTTLRTTKTVATVTSRTTITTTKTMTPSQVISTTMTKNGKCPLPFPTGCGVEGLEWAVFKNAQGTELTPDLHNFDSQLYQHQVPERSGEHVGPNGPGIGSDGVIPNLYDTGPYDTEGDYVIFNIRGYLYTTASGEYWITITSGGAQGVYLWFGDAAFSYNIWDAEIQSPCCQPFERLSRDIEGENSTTTFDVDEINLRGRGERDPHHRTYRIRPRYDLYTAIEQGIDSYVPIRLMTVVQGSGSGFQMDISVPSIENVRDYNWYAKYATDNQAIGRLVLAKSSCRGERAGLFSPWGQGG